MALAPAPTACSQSSDGRAVVGRLDCVFALCPLRVMDAAFKIVKVQGATDEVRRGALKRRTACTLATCTTTRIALRRPNASAQAILRAYDVDLCLQTLYLCFLMN
jgi:hypothetical protein